MTSGPVERSSMGYQEQLLEILELNRGTFLSGEALAKQMYVSRNAVWKAIKKLREAGYPITAVTNKGYALAMDSDILSAASIAAQSDNADRLHIRVENCVTSTNTILKEEAAKGAPEGTLLVSLEQTAGRGRMGRTFLSPKQTGIYMSLILRPRMEAKDALMLTTSVAVAVCETISELTGREAGIKWVNDIFLDGRKVCGILTEASIDFETQGLEYAVVGLGVNLSEPQGGFDKSISGIAGSLFSEQAIPMGFREKLIAGIVDRFLYHYDHLLERSFLESYRAHSILIGRLVTVIDNIHASGESRRARVLAIEDDCSLLVELPDGTQEKLSSGEVSLKL